jgi:hypothetical protein
MVDGPFEFTHHPSTGSESLQNGKVGYNTSFHGTCTLDIHSLNNPTVFMKELTATQILLTLNCFLYHRYLRCGKD